MFVDDFTQNVTRKKKTIHKASYTINDDAGNVSTKKYCIKADDILHGLKTSRIRKDI